MTLFLFLDGRAGSGFDYETPEERAKVVALLGRLHAATSVAARTAGVEDFTLPYRAGLDSAMADVENSWSGGPFSEPAREQFAPAMPNVQSLLGVFDRMVEKANTERDGWVITHGEPKPSNVMTTQAGPLLIDWDTALVAPPERDLWMVVTQAGDERRIYADATGRQVNDDTLTLYRLFWELSEIAGYISWFRLPHVKTADTETAWRSLNRYLEQSRPALHGG
jgi:spectinomycin phosphotransferase